MESIGTHLTNERLKLLRERHLKAKTKKEKPQILDGYCCNTGQARKSVMPRSFNNFFQPVMNLVTKKRFRGRVSQED